MIEETDKSQHVELHQKAEKENNKENSRESSNKNSKKENIQKATGPFKTIVKGAGYAFLGMIIGRVLSYLFNFTATQLGSKSYGLLSMGFAIFLVFQTIAILGLRRGVIKYIALYRSLGDEQRIKGTITSSLKIGVGLAVLLAVFMFFFSDYIAGFFDPALSPILKILAFFLPLSVAGDFFLNAMVAFHQNKYSVFVEEVLEKLVKCVLAAVFVFVGFGAKSLTLAYGLGVATTFTISFILLEKKVFPIIKTKIKSIDFKKELLQFSFPLFLAGVLALVIAWTDVLMIGHFRTASEVGIYNAALITASLLLIIPIAFTSLFLPIITTYHAKNLLDEFKAIYRRTAKWIFIFNIPLFLILVFFPAQVQTTLFGKEYALGGAALAILAIGYFCHTLSLTSLQTLYLLKKTNKIFWINAFSAVLNIIINYLLIPKYGMVGGAIATSFSFILGSILVIIYCHRTMKVHPFKAIQWKILLGSIAGVFSIFMIKNFVRGNFINFAWMALLFVLIYGGIILLLKVLDEEDWEIIKVILVKLRLKKGSTSS